MTAKTYLRQIGRIESRIARLDDQLSTVFEEMRGVKSVDYGAGTVHSSSSADERYINLIAKYDKAYTQLLKEKEKLLRVRSRIISEIESMDDERFKNVLYMRYVNQFDWNVIQGIMHVSERQVYRIHGEALSAFSNKFNLGS